MKEKVTELHIRLNEKEKKKLQRNAKKCGLTLSSYLRKVGLKQEIYSIPNEDFYKIYVSISNLKSEIFDLKIDEIDMKLEQIQREFLNIYNSKKWENDNGND